MAGDEVSFRNDERELAQRDRAHYMAYQAVGLAGLAPWMLSSLRMTKPGLTAWIPMGADQLYFGLTTVVLLLFLTLPQAILLWTEPDMEARGRWGLRQRGLRKRFSSPRSQGRDLGHPPIRCRRQIIQSVPSSRACRDAHRRARAIRPIAPSHLFSPRHQA